MRGSITIAHLAGIPIRIHWTFLILLAWIGVAGWARGDTPREAALAVAFIASIFACVVLHELGHALAARSIGIATRDITLLPIGGIASLERIPEKPWQELYVALAGPAVNLVIAAVLIPAVAWGEGVDAFLALERSGGTGGNLLAGIAAVNVSLLLFNLLPAFPMDGGRVLRALLAAVMDHVTATRVAAGVGQVVAVGFALAGLFGSPILLLIALFVWFGAGAEAQMVEARAVLRGLPVRAAMVTRFRTLAPGDTLQAAGEELLAGSQQDFPVTQTGQPDSPVVGILTRADLVRALAAHGLNAPVRDAMRADCRVVSAREPLERVFAAMQESDCPLVPVVHEGRVVGIVTTDNIGELLLLRTRGRAGFGAAPRA